MVRGDCKVSSHTRVVFCTYGVMLRRLQEDSSLKSIDCIILDEIHGTYALCIMHYAYVYMHVYMHVYIFKKMYIEVIFFFYTQSVIWSPTFLWRYFFELCKSGQLFELFLWYTYVYIYIYINYFNELIYSYSLPQFLPRNLPII